MLGMCKCLRKTNYPDSLQCTLAPSPVCTLPTRQAALVLASGHNFLKFSVCVCIITRIPTPSSLVAIIFKCHFRFFILFL